MRWLKRHVYDPGNRTFTLFGLDDGYLLAAGVAYYVGLSFFPLLMVLISGLGAFLKFTNLGQDAKAHVLEVVAQNFSEETAVQAKDLIGHFAENAPVGWVGVLILLFTTGTIFAQFERAFDRIWRYTAPEDLSWAATIKSILIERVTAFVLLIGVGALIAATFVAGLVLDAVQKFADQYLPLPTALWGTLQIVATVLINTLAFGVLYHTLPRARVKWKEAFRGGAVVAVVWEIGRQVLGAFLIGDRYSAYGVVGALLAIQLWAYYGVTVILLGAEYVRVTCQHCTSGAAADMNRRRFWQLMSRMVARGAAPPTEAEVPVTPPVLPPPEPDPHDALRKENEADAVVPKT